MRVIRFSAIFRRDYKNIGHYVILNFGLETYLVVESNLQKTLNILRLFPRIGRKVLVKDNIFAFVFGVNIIYYKFNEKEIRFLKILNTKQDR